MLNYRTAQTADLPAMMKMVEEAKEGFRARNIDQWQKGEPNEQGLIVRLCLVGFSFYRCD